VDYPTIEAALKTVKTERSEQCTSIRILCRPGKYYLRKAITVDAPGTALVRIESMELPRSIQPSYVTSIPLDSTPIYNRRRSSSRNLRDILSCRSVDVDDEEPPMEDIPAEYPEQMLAPPLLPQLIMSRRATLILKTRKENEPLVRVRQGTCKLKGLQIRHVCHGTGTF
jgi:hypothetical protein